MEFITLSFNGQAPWGNTRFLDRWMPRAGIRRRNNDERMPKLPPITDFGAISGKKVTCALDSDNIDICLRRCFNSLSYETLARRIIAVAGQADLLAVPTVSGNHGPRESRLSSAGWRVLPIPVEIIQTHKGSRRKANADHDIAFEVGYQVRTNSPEVVLIGTGDGDLAVAMARGIKRHHPEIKVITLSVNGFTSHRLMTKTELFDGNILIGLDVTHPFVCSPTLST